MWEKRPVFLSGFGFGLRGRVDVDSDALVVASIMNLLNEFHHSLSAARTHRVAGQLDATRLLRPEAYRDIAESGLAPP